MNAPHSLDALFNPRAVAIVGASSDPDRIGGRVLRFLIESGFAGALHPVNRSGAAEIQGLKAYASVQEIPGTIDQAIVLVPVAGVEAAVRESIAKGVRCVLVLTAGFAETGAEGRALQQRLAARCGEAGVRLVGPNSLGLIDVASRYHATFTTALYGLKPREGDIALATQSGAFGSAAWGAATQRGLGFSRIVATGNEADVDVAECIDYLAGDDRTRVICAALESCRDGQRLRAALRRAARAGKPVIVMKVGRTELGAAAASTHTGSLAGNDAVFDAVFAECGAFRAHSIEEMLDVAELCSTSGGLPPNDDLGLVTASGGIGVLMADQAGECGLRMSALPPAGVQDVRETMPFAVAANPLDTTAQVTSVPGGFGRATQAMLAHHDYGTVIAYLANAGLTMQRFSKRLAEFSELRERFPDRHIVLVMLHGDDVKDVLRPLRIAVFSDPSRAVRAVAGAARLRERHARVASQVPAATVVPMPLPPADTEHAAKRVLAEAGLPVPEERLCASAEEAAQAARLMGFPLVAKIASPDIAHKTEVGGVILELHDADAVKAAFATLMDRARAARPQARLDGVLLAPQLRGGVETLLGVQVDPSFGPMIMFGAGGTAVELYRDVALASAPLSPQAARELIGRVRSSALLRGWRGAPKLDEDALVRALCALSDFAVRHAGELDSIDINPFVVQRSGAWCLDAVIARRVAQVAPHTGAH